MHRSLLLCLLLLALPQLSQAQAPEQWTSGEIQQAIQKLNVLGSVLYLAAHPDDENTRMIAWLANDKKAHTAYLSLTRGDGGQNLIGPEIRELMGIMRTQELLQARRIDGGHQYFSRANDFGFSKNPEETLAIWDKEKVLADIVWIIRKMQPDLIINRFPHTPAKTHGHHTASAQLSYEAFDAAADPKRFPEQLQYVSVWQAKRLLLNDAEGFYDTKETFEAGKAKRISVDVGSYYPLLGKSNNEIAGESRSQHQCQGMGTARERGTKTEYLLHIKGKAAQNDPFDDIDLSWDRLAKSKGISEQIMAINKIFQAAKPTASVDALLVLRENISSLENSVWKTRKLAEVEEIIAQCLGLFLEVSADVFASTKGDQLQLNIEAINRSSYPVSLQGIALAKENKGATAWKPVDLAQNIAYQDKRDIRCPEGDFSRPYWLKEAGTVGLYTVKNQLNIGYPELSNLKEIDFHLRINKTDIHYKKSIIYKEVDPVKGEVYRPFVISPELSVNVSDKTLVFVGEQAKTVDLILKSGKKGVKGNLLVQVPKGWITDPATISFNLEEKGDELPVSLQITPPKTASEGELSFLFHNKTAQERIEIAYDHIPTQLLFLDAKVKLVKPDLQLESGKIGYFMGAGDQMPASLRQIGYEVVLLEDSDMNSDKLAIYDAVVIGIRAYNTKPRLKFHKEALMNYVKNGGNLIVQYNTNHRLVTDDFAPYPLTLSRDRVTDENATVTFLKPDHPVLNKPNKITTANFEGWVQERGLYFPSEWAKEYQAILSMHDKGEKPKKSSLLVAKYGKGNYIYTGISWFRELPAGVPGAYRLFANLIELE